MGKIMDETQEFSILRVTRVGREEITDRVVTESPLTVWLNGSEVVTLLCSPTWQEPLAVGYLFSEELLRDRSEITALSLDREQGVVHLHTGEGRPPEAMHPAGRVVTSGSARATTSVTLSMPHGLERAQSAVQVTARAVMDLVQQFQHHSEVYMATHGVHSAALSDGERILVFAEDIGRHNAVDKVMGRCMLDGITTDDKLLVLSSRVSSEMLLKAARGRVPIVVSISAPTSLAVSWATDLRITLVGFARDNRMNVYSESWRIRDDG